MLLLPSLAVLSKALSTLIFVAPAYWVLIEVSGTETAIEFCLWMTFLRVSAF